VKFKTRKEKEKEDRDRYIDILEEGMR